MSESSKTDDRRAGDTSDASCSNGVGGAPAPRYITVANYLRGMIYNHELEPGEKIPSEHQLMDRFDIARGTARHAIKILAEEGLLRQSHGRGTFVSYPDITHSIGDFPLSMARSLAGQGLAFETHVTVSKVQVPPPAMQVILDIKPGHGALYVERTRVVEGNPMFCQESWVSLVECPTIGKSDLEQESLLDAIEESSGRKVTSSTMRYSARSAGTKYASAFGCDESTAILVLEQVVTLSDGRPASWGRTWLRPGQTVEGTVSL